jgi:hypothetical protein
LGTIEQKTKLTVFCLFEDTVNQSLYRPGQALRVPGYWSSQISWKSAHEGDKFVSPTHRPPLPTQKILLVLISLRGWVDPMTMGRPEGLLSKKNSNDTIGNRTWDLQVCSAVSQPTAPPRVTFKDVNTTNSNSFFSWNIYVPPFLLLRPATVIWLSSCCVNSLNMVWGAASGF